MFLSHVSFNLFLFFFLRWQVCACACGCHVLMKVRIICVVPIYTWVAHSHESLQLRVSRSLTSLCTPSQPSTYGMATSFFVWWRQL